jgi:hypothetical protein
VTEEHFSSHERALLERVLRHALGATRWNAALVQPDGEGMLLHYLEALYATLRETAPEFPEEECELALMVWLDDGDHDMSLDFHTYAVAWRSALRARRTFVSADQRDELQCTG